MKPFFTPEPVIFFNSPLSKKFPGNTIKSIEDGFFCGADVVCFNIQFSKDKVVMAISDLTIDNLCEAAGKVSDFTSSELKNFDAGYRFSDENGNFTFRDKGFRFHTLDEILQSFPDKRFNITIMAKDDALVESYISIVKKNNAASRVLTTTMFGRNIKIVRKLMPESPTAFTLAGIIGVYGLFKSGLINLFNGFKADALQTPEAIGTSYIANSGLIHQLHLRDIKVHVWYVKDRIQLKRVYDAGADGFMVDDISMVKDFLAERHPV